ncbi:MAG: UDP-N-acetylmuramoyl-tripeptide--D-alanyl-D-alanine ligase, partial [Prochlorothrix sp.]
TKELIAAMLATRGPVLKTEANYNNEIGVPKTLLNLRQEHQFAVIEMAMRGPGEIGELAAIAEPTIGVITNVGVAHIERLGSREAIAAAKTELLAHMAQLEAAAGNPGDRLAILNADNGLLMEAAGQRWRGKTRTFGLTQGDLHGKLLDPETLKLEGEIFSLPLAGEHNALNFLAALAVAEAVGIPRSTLTQLQVTLPGGRAKRLVWGGADQDIVALDETYNAGPESMAAALRLLKQTPGQRHIAVLGTMKELGPHSVQFHREVGELVAELAIDRLLILADPAETAALCQGAAAVPTESFTDQASLVARLQGLIQPGDRLLFKASRSVALDQVVTQLDAQYRNSSVA